MPGIVVCGRRWSIGSDDLVVPMIFLIFMHLTWLVALGVARGVGDFTSTEECAANLRDLILGYLVLISVSLVLECSIAFVSTRGSILTHAPRSSIEYLLYGRCVVGLVEISLLILGTVWASRHYNDCPSEVAKRTLLGVMICNWFMFFLFIISLWCTFDTAGRKWVKMKKFQDSLKVRRATDRRRGQRQSGSRRNWRQRKAFRAYEESWDRRLQLLCCCVERKAATRNSMSEIASLFTDFFRDLDVVPSDIVAGLVLLRRHQQQRMNAIISQGSNDVYQFLSGVPITPKTRFLQLSRPEVMFNFQKVIHYMKYALAVYGWPIYVKMFPGTWCCRLLPLIGCCCCKKEQTAMIVDDNCCMCNFSTAKPTSGLEALDVVYCTYHVAIGETPFFVALDHEYKKVVVAIRGTLSLQDVLTDLQAEPETLPLDSPKDDWQGHKGMIQAAVYIKRKLIDDKILQMAWDNDEERDTSKYDLVLVGHSLGAGTAAILAILLHADYPTLHCYAYSPPGGLLTLTCVEETKYFITSVVVGKDCVPRIGLPQLEMLRADILNQIKNSSDAKWKIITKGLMCCGRKQEGNLAKEMLERDVTAHPSNSAIGLSAHLPLYPPGQMIHVVRSHLTDKNTRGACDDSNYIYQAVWANNGDFDEVLISPTMLADHMADKVLDALQKVVEKKAPQKPVHTLTEDERRRMLNQHSFSSQATPSDEAGSSVDINNVRGSEDSHLGVNEVFMEEVDDSMLFGLPNSETEELVKAPLASPETLSMASGIAVFNPNSNPIGRDNLRQSLNKCAEKSMNSPSEILRENDVVSVQRGVRTSSQRSNSSPNSRKNKHPHNSSTNNRDVELGNNKEPDEYHVKLRSGNTISVKADVVNEMIKQNHKASAPAKTSGDQAATETNGTSAVLEPSSHTHFVSPSHQKQVRSEDPQHLSCIEESAQMIKPESIGLIIGWGSHGGDDGSEDGRGLLDDYTRHSPSESNQHEYGHPNVYYSQAGIGYPHNAFHPPLRFNSFPCVDPLDNLDIHENETLDNTGDTSLVTNSEENLDKTKPSQKKPFTHAESESNLLDSKKQLPRMKRSAEQGDIAHLCDALEVFETEEDKVRLCQSACTLQEETSEDVMKAEEETPADPISPSPATKSKSHKQSVSFGGSTIIPGLHNSDTAVHDRHSKDLHSAIKSSSPVLNDSSVLKHSQDWNSSNLETSPLLSSAHENSNKHDNLSHTNAVLLNHDSSTVQETHL